DVGDVRIALTEALDDGPAPPAVAGNVRTRHPREITAWTLAAIATATALTLIAGTRARDGEQRVTRVELSLPDGIELFLAGGKAVALSPDGRSLAFVGVHSGGRQIYVRRLDQSDATALRGTEGAFTCFFSPDGAALGFVSTNGSLQKVSLADGL